MAAFTLTNAAKEDIKEIGRYTRHKWGTAQRDKYLALLHSAFISLVENPSKGRNCSHIRNGYRVFNVGSHLIFYRQQPEGAVTIVRVLHQSMDVEVHLLS